MSIKVISRVLDHSAQRGAARLLLVALADFANDDGVCWPGMAKLSQKINESERNTLLIINRLLNSGELLRVVGGGRGRSTLYGIASGLGPSELKTLNKALDRASRINPVNPVPEYGVSRKTSRQKATKPDPESENPVPRITDPEITDLFAKRSVIFSDDDEGQNTAPESDKTPRDENANRHDHDPSLVVEVGRARKKNPLVRDLIRIGIFPQPARQIAAMGLDPPTVLRFAADMLADGCGPGAIADYLRDAPPTQGERYVARTAPPAAAPAGDRPSTSGRNGGSSGRDARRSPRPGDRGYRSARARDGPGRPADGE